jgi:hypothetical protein
MAKKHKMHHEKQGPFTKKVATSTKKNRKGSGKK